MTIVQAYDSSEGMTLIGVKTEANARSFVAKFNNTEVSLLLPGENETPCKGLKTLKTRHL